MGFKTRRCHDMPKCIGLGDAANDMRPVIYVITRRLNSTLFLDAGLLPVTLWDILYSQYSATRIGNVHQLITFIT